MLKLLDTCHDNAIRTGTAAAAAGAPDDGDDAAVGPTSHEQTTVHFLP